MSFLEVIEGVTNVVELLETKTPSPGNMDVGGGYVNFGPQDGQYEGGREFAVPALHVVGRPTGSVAQMFDKERFFWVGVELKGASSFSDEPPNGHNHWFRNVGPHIIDGSEVPDGCQVTVELQCKPAPLGLPRSPMFEYHIICRARMEHIFDAHFECDLRIDEFAQLATWGYQAFPAEHEVHFFPGLDTKAWYTAMDSGTGGAALFDCVVAAIE